MVQRPIRIARHVTRAGAACLLVLLAGGCLVGSREPLYDRSRDAVFDPRLVGTWRGQDGDVRISAGLGRSYRVGGTDGDEVVSYDLVRIGCRLYMFPQVPDSGLGTVLVQSFQVRRAGRRLRIRALDVSVLAERLRQGRAGLAYETVDVHTGLFAARRASTSAPATTGPVSEEIIVQNLVLTDRPDRIRRFLADHEDDPELFPLEIVLKKISR